MKEYESLEFAPESIKAKIVDVEQLGITEVGVLKYPKVYWFYDLSLKYCISMLILYMFLSFMWGTYSTYIVRIE